MESLWMQDYSPHRGMTLSGNIETDTVIVGGGLAGILCAKLLQERGIQCVVLEAKQIGMGITRNTTAKITAQHGLIYAKLEDTLGFDAAREYLRANQEAIETYRRFAKDIACDFEEKTAYVYSKNSRDKLEREADVYRRMGVEPVFLKDPPVPAKTVGALGMAGQAQFHPPKFLQAIAGGLRVYENTLAVKILPGKVITQNGSVQARRVILATHYPMLNLRGLYFLKLYQHRSYVLALSGAPDPGGMFIDEQEDGLSLRTHNGYLLLGGGSHKTGKQGGGWAELRAIAKAVYPTAKECFAWATQDCMSLDGMPYIGRHHEGSRELYVASGFNKWGMTGSMVAAELLSTLIAEGQSRYSRLFSPSRSMLHPQLFVNIAQSVVGLLSFGKRCPHMGCALKWNAQEQTWDCPCHGSRFDKEGNLIDNPARKGIKVD